MKKYLINGAMALIVGGFLASCTHDDVGAPATVNDRTKSFDEMFTELYGPIAENHNWGFATVAVPAEAIAAAEAEAAAAATRAATRKADPGDYGEWFGPQQADYYKQLGLVAPEMVSAGEEKFVSDWFKANEKPSSDPIDLSTFFVQQVYFGTKEYTGYDGNNAKHTVIGGQHMDWLCAYDPTGTETTVWVRDYPGTDNYAGHNETIVTHDDHINNFNTSAPQRFWTEDGTYNVRTYMAAMMLMVNSSTSRFGCKESQGTDNKVYYNYVIKALKYNGKWGYYVGFDYENHGQNGDFPKDGYYDDRIIKIVPGNGIMPWTPTENPDAYQESKTKKTYTHKQIVDQGRVFCEDIATANMKVTEDIDYNDIVFDARVWQIYDQDATTVNNITSNSAPYNYRWQYDISLLATGGTIEEKINGIDVHNKFGVGQSFMVNTWTPNCVSTLSGQWNTPTNVIQPKDFSYTLTYDELPLDPEDNSKRLAGINTIPIEVHYGGKQMVALENRNLEERTGEDGNKYIVSSAPYKLCLPVGTQWPIERVNIQKAYSDFSSYVSSPNNLFYKGTKVSENLYTQAPESSIQKDGKTTESPEEVTQSGDAENSNVWVVWKGDVSTDGSAITLYNFTFQSGQTLRFFGSGTITVVCGEGSGTGVITDGSMEAGFVDVTIRDADVASKLSQGIQVSGSNFSLTKIVVL